jgi:asparagine synthase (glutamine-hydrolysing)
MFTYSKKRTSIGIPIYWTAEKAAETKLKVLLAGQSADELFGGYRRYTDDYQNLGEKQARERMRQDINTIHKTNLERDFKICNSHSIELRLPFATYDMAKLALRLPISLKIEPKQDGLRKLVLRQAAKNIGLPDLVLKKPKKAIQYTTGVDKALRKWAKKQGMPIKQLLNKRFREIIKKRMQGD